MKRDLNIYITTSDDYHHCLKPFAFLFNKFWSSDKKVTFLGYKEPQVKLPLNFDFISLGEQRGPSYYSEDLRSFYESIDDSHFICTMEDQFILDYVNFDVIDKLSEYLDRDKVGRACLTNSILGDPNIPQGKKHDNYDIQEDYEIIEYSQDSEFRMTTEWTIWNKDYLCRHLPNGLTPWQFESMNSKISKHNGYHLIGCKNKVAIYHAEALRRRYWGRDFDFKFVNDDRYLDNSIIEDMKKEKII